MYHTGEVIEMKNRRIKLVLNDMEYQMILKSLVQLRNSLLAAGKASDLVDELLLKLCK